MTKKKKEKQWWRKYTKEYAEEEPLDIIEHRKREKKPSREKKEHAEIDPFDSLNRMQKMMDQTFRDLLGGGKGLFGMPRTPKLFKMEGKLFRQPRVEIKQTEKEIRVRVELPGTKKKDIKIKIEGRNLIIDAQIKQKEEKREEGFESFSFGYKGFRNVIALPTDVDKSKAKASFESGVLTLTLTKLEPGEGGPTDIEIE